MHFSDTEEIIGSNPITPTIFLLSFLDKTHTLTLKKYEGEKICHIKQLKNFVKIEKY